MMGFASTTADQVCAKPRKYATCRPRQYVAAPASKVLERYRKSVTKNERINHFYMITPAWLHVSKNERELVLSWETVVTIVYSSSVPFDVTPL